MSAATPGDSPYKGLMPYSEQDAPFFFGREPEQEIISANLVAARLTLLYGASGVGKSSVLRAGVAYHLREESLRNLAERGNPEFIVVTFSSWRDDPVDSLMKRVADSVARVLKDKPLEPVPPSRSLAQTLQAWTERVGGDLIIILDQFEEYFLYHAQEDGEGTFAVEFPRAVNRPDLRATFLISIREDALAKLDRFKGRIPNLFNNYLRIEHLAPDAARMAIEKPIEAYNHLHPEAPSITIEPQLIDAVLDEVKTGKVVLGETGSGVVASAAADARIETPFLQLVMTRLWDEEKRNGSRVLRLATLQDLGGAERIVRTHLDAVMREFAPREQDIAARVFRYLVTRSGTKIAHTTTDLAEYAQVPEDELKPVLEKLSAPEIRILRPVASPPDQPQVPRYEIFHDVLASAILDWRARFVKAQEQAEAEMRVTREQVEAQKQLQLSFARRRARLLQIGMIGLSVLLVAILALTIFAFLQWDRASRSAADALTQRDVAVAAQATTNREANARATAVADANQARISAEQARGEVMSYVVAADAVAQLQNDKQLSLLLAIEAAKFSPGADAEDALRRALLDPEVATLAGHTGGVNDAAFSPDGKTVATGSVDRTVRLWETSTGKLLRVWDSEFVYKLAFSPNGKWLVTTGSDAESIAHVWDASTGRLVADLKGHEDSISRGAFSPDSNWIVTASRDGTARVWETSTGKQLIVLRGHVGSVRRAEFSPDGRFIVTAGGDLFPSGGEVTAQGGDGTARVWDAKTGQQLAKLVGHTGPVIDATFSPDGKSVLTGSADGSTRIWGVDPDKLTGPTPRVVTSSFSTTILTGTVSTGVVTSTVWNTVFSPDGNYIAAAYGRPSNQARVWNAKTGKLVAVMSGHTDFVFFVTFSPDGKWVATASRDGTARVWSALTSKELVELRRHTDWVNVAPFSPDGTLVLTASDDGTARLWQLVSPLALLGHTREVLRALFNSDGRLVATASADNTARVWEASTGKTVAELRGHTSFVRSAVFSPNDKLVVTASDDRTARVWDATTGMTVAVLSGHKAPVTSAAFSPDSKLVVTASADGTARVWNAGSGITVTVMNGHTATVNSAAFSPNGKLVVTSSADRTARVWDAGAGNSVSVIRGHNDNVVSAAFSPDGKYVLTASWDRTASIWDATTGVSVTTLSGHTGPVLSAAFSRDGRFVVTSSSDRTARVWETSTGKLVVELRGHTDAVTSAVFSADGALVATASLDRTARVWEANTGKQIAAMRENTGAVNSVAFSPDGKSVVTASTDAAHIEPISIQELIQLANSRLTRTLTCEERNTYLRENIVCPTPTPTPTPTRAPTWTPTPPRTPVLLRTPIPVPSAARTP